MIILGGARYEPAYAPIRFAWWSGKMAAESVTPNLIFSISASTSR
jgi:hypothetical protein